MTVACELALNSVGKHFENGLRGFLSRMRRGAVAEFGKRICLEWFCTASRRVIPTEGIGLAIRLKRNGKRNERLSF
jgi:hypothetical protein